MTEQYKDCLIETTALLNPDGSTWLPRLKITRGRTVWDWVSVPGTYTSEQAALDAAMIAAKIGVDQIDQGGGSFILVGVPPKPGQPGDGVTPAGTGTIIDPPTTSARPVIYKESTVSANAAEIYAGGPWRATVTVTTLTHPTPQTYPVPGTFPNGDAALAAAQALGQSIVDQIGSGTPPPPEQQLVSKTTYPYKGERIYIESDPAADGKTWTAKITIYTLTAHHDYNVVGNFPTSDAALQTAWSTGKSLVDRDKGAGGA